MMYNLCMKVAIVQLNASSSIKDNIEKAVEIIEEASASSADIVLFPECFISSYSFPLKTVEEKDLGPILSCCRDHSIGAVITAFMKSDDGITDSALLISKEGAITMRYDKVHICAFSDEKVLQGGKGFPVSDFCGVKIGIMICYDREYPESGRSLILAGAELILVPSDTYQMKPRNMELMVCALQNACYVASANPPGDDKGCSSMYSPFAWKENVKVAEADESFCGIIYGDVDTERLREWREKEDIGKYRHPETYRY